VVPSNLPVRESQVWELAITPFFVHNLRRYREVIHRSGSLLHSLLIPVQHASNSQDVIP